MTLEEIEVVVSETMNMLEAEYDITELENHGSVTANEIAARIASEQELDK